MAYWFLVMGGALSFVGMLIHGLIGGKIYAANIKKERFRAIGKDVEPFFLAVSLDTPFRLCGHFSLHCL